MESIQEIDSDKVNLFWDVQLMRYHGVAALTFLVWDTAITWRDEVQYIWSQPKTSPTKWVFLFTRYFGLLFQARLLSINLSLILEELSVDKCRELYISQVVYGGLLLACIQAILMLRVYALYIQDRRIAYAMIALLVAEVGSLPGIIYKTVPNDIGRLCMKPINAQNITFFGVSAILQVPQLFVLGLTIKRYRSGLRAGWGRIPIVSRLVRDDIILVSVILVWTILGVSLMIVKTVYGYIAYYWLISIIPSAVCLHFSDLYPFPIDSDPERKNFQIIQSTRYCDTKPERKHRPHLSRLSSLLVYSTCYRYTTVTAQTTSSNPCPQPNKKCTG